MIFIDDGTHREEAHGIWQRNFHDPVLYAEFYFNEVYGRNTVYFEQIQEDEEEVFRGMLHLNPYTLWVGKEKMAAHYIVGVSTEEDYRRQGVMRSLLHQSMSDMRKSGEAFTYLMPADEDYYLPFDFRYGMVQLEQEVDYRETKQGIPEEYTFYEYKEYLSMFGEHVLQEEAAKNLPDSLERICQAECEEKAKHFSLFTEITPQYLDRMNDEAESDFGKTILVFKNGTYYGRFVAGAEYSYLILSQIHCQDQNGRREFLKLALDYCVKKFGDYGSYQFVLDESWEDAVLPAGPYGVNRILPCKKVKKIMFRILDVEGMAKYIDMKEKDGNNQCILHIKDSFLNENDGFYLFQWGNRPLSIKKLSDMDQTSEPGLESLKSDGTLSIASLTELIFGDKGPGELKEREELSAQALHLLGSIQPLRKCCIMEIV